MYIRGSMDWWKKEWAPERADSGSGWAPRESLENSEPLFDWLDRTRSFAEEENASVCNIGCMFDYMEFGCYKPLRKRFKNITYVDVAQDALDDLKKNVDASVKTYLTEGLELSGINSNHFDLIISVDSLVYLETEEVLEYFEEFRRVLKPSGVYSIHFGRQGAAHSVIDYEQIHSKVSEWSNIISSPGQCFISGVKR